MLKAACRWRTASSSWPTRHAQCIRCGRFSACTVAAQVQIKVTAHDSHALACLPAEKMFGISPPAPTPPSQAPLQPEQEAPPTAPGFQPSEGELAHYVLHIPGRHAVLSAICPGQSVRWQATPCIHSNTSSAAWAQALTGCSSSPTCRAANQPAHSSSAGSTFSPIYGSTPGHLTRVKPVGVKLDKDRLRAQRMLNLETKGTGQQQQLRPLQQPASEPRGEVALGISGHHQHQQRPPQQHAQGPLPVPATATPQPPAAAAGGPGSNEAAPQQTRSGSVPPAGQPAAGTQPAAAQRPLRGGKPPVAAAAAARPEGQTGTTRPPAEAKAAPVLKRKRAQEGPAPAAGAVLVAGGPGTSQQPEKMRKAVPAGGVVPHAGGAQGCANLYWSSLTMQRRGLAEGRGCGLHLSHLL